MSLRVFILCSLFSLPLFVTDRAYAQPLSLQECYQAAFKQNAALKISTEKFIETSAKLSEAKGQRGPTLSLSGSATHNGDVTKANFGSSTIQFQPDNSYRIGFALSQMLFDGGRGLFNKELQKLSLERIRSDHGKSEIELAYQVATVYNRWVYSQSAERIAKLSVVSAKEHSELTTKRFQAGQVSKLDMLRTSVSANQLEVNAESAIANRQRIVETLRYLTGLAIDDSQFPSDTIDRIPENLQVDSGLAIAKRFRPEYRQYESNSAIANTGIQLAKSGLYPMITSSSSLVWANGSDPFDPDKLKRQWNVGIQCSYTLFDGKQSRAKIEVARSGARQTDILRSDFTTLVRNEIEQAVININDAKRRYAMQDVFVEQAEEAYLMAKAQYLAGQTPAIEVSDAELALSAARINREQARYDLRNAVFEYEKATGELSTRFKPEGHQ